MIYGRGDHLSHTVHTLPAFETVGLRKMPIRMSGLTTPPVKQCPRDNVLG